jgi:hypothetical protein
MTHSCGLAPRPILQAPNEIPRVHAQSARKTGDQIEAGVPPPGFQACDVNPVDVGLERKSFLRQLRLVATGTDAVPELDLPSRLPFVRAAHPDS